MKKFHTHDKYTKENHPRESQRTEGGRNSSKHDPSGYREDYFADENGYHNYSYQTERRPKNTLQNYDYKKTRCSTNQRNEHPRLLEAKKGMEHSGTRDNYKKFHNDPPLHSSKGNAHPQSKNPTFNSNISKTTDTRIKLKNEYSPVNAEDECFNSRKSSNKISVNKENLSRNHDVKNTHFEEKSSLPLLQKYSRPVYESNQSIQDYNKQNNDQSSAYSHDLCRNNVHASEERANSHSYNTSNNFQNVAFLNDFASHEEGMGFNVFKLTDLLYYNVNLMQDQQLFEYASAVKCKVLEKIDKFQYPEKDELEVLCEITDGDQSEKNQRLITTRTCHIVRNIMEKFPLLLNAKETPHSSQIVYQTVPNLQGLTNSYCINYGPPVLEIVQNSDVFTSTKDYNLMSEYNIAQNEKCVISKAISDSFEAEVSNDYRGKCEVQNFNTNNVKNNSPTNSSMITGENKETTFSEHCSLPAENSDCASVNNFSFNEEDSTFIVFGLDNLLKYDVNAMHGDMVFDYGFSMKQRILEQIHLFEDPYKEKLEFLCELTDGTQREQNQKLINEQMCYLINSASAEKSEHEDSQHFTDEQSRNLYSRGSCYSDSKRR